MANGTDYIWDVDELKSMVSSLKRKKKDLESEIRKLGVCGTNLQSEWSSTASENFVKFIVLDIKNLGIVLNGLEKTIDSLSNLVDKYYEECEKKVNNKINNMVTGMRW
ncbi:MAG: hypothetical protein J6J16_02185 [Lachnospiraceae bacterium]|nr:hypothetical protein [Lachnospiraceae bacterium]